MAESGQTDRAIEEFQKAVQFDSLSATPHFHLGLAYDRVGRSSEAISEYETAIRLEPGLIDARYALSAACWKRGDGDGAIQMLRQVLSRNPPFAAEVHYNLGLELGKQGRIDEAANELKTAVELQPRAEFYSALGKTLTQRQDLEGAIQAAKMAADLAPRNVEYNYNLAETLRLQGELDAAEADFRNVASLNPKYPQVHRQLGLVLRQKGNYEAALTELRVAVSDNPDAETLYYLGSVLLKLNKLDEAIGNLAKSVRLDPYDSAVRVTLAGALAKAGRATEAEEERAQAKAIDQLKANAGKSTVLLGSAVEHLNKGDVDAALNELRESSALSPEYADVQFELARALRQKGAPATEVEGVLRRVIELKPDHARAHLELGLLLDRMGQKSESARELRRALQLAPSLVEAHRALGRAALAARDWETVVVEFGALLAWKQDDVEAQKNLSVGLTSRNKKQ